MTVMIRVINISFSIMTEFSSEIYTIRFISSINILRGERGFFLKFYLVHVLFSLVLASV